MDDKENLDRFDDDEEGGKKYQLLSRFQIKIILENLASLVFLARF